MVLHLDTARWAALKDHMDHRVERAAFLFASHDTGALHVRDIWLLDDDGYDISTADHLAAHEDALPEVIRRAHAGNHAVIEAHSHNSRGQTRFSNYDLDNIAELARHMLWRLPGRPYTALVIGPDSFDALQWAPDAQSLTEVDIAGDIRRPTGLSLATIGKGSRR